jgi:hypothetical protein
MEICQTRKHEDDRIRLNGLPRTIPALLAVAGIVVLFVAGAMSQPARKGDDSFVWFSASYLISYIFFLSISLGALFFVVLQHVVRAGWSAAVRRLAEILAINVLWWGLLFLPVLVPVLMGTSPLYKWSRPAAVAADELLQHKSLYLNGPFFAVRAVVYFLAWGLLACFFLRLSMRQDNSRDPKLTCRMEKVAPAAMIAFGLTVTFASIDWLMSLQPDWFSTIFGLYFFAGSVVAALAALILFAAVLQSRGIAANSITAEHYHDLGKLLLGFVVFWGYMAFSQYLLIWYANIPEETVWYLTRQTGPWKWITIGLLFGNLLIPFLGLLPREVKRRKMLLSCWAVWLLLVHWIDLYWLAMPAFAPDQLPFGVADVCCIVGLACLFLAGVLQTSRGYNLIPLGDPRLAESLAFENH